MVSTRNQENMQYSSPIIPCNAPITMALQKLFFGGKGGGHPTVTKVKDSNLQAFSTRPDKYHHIMNGFLRFFSNV